MVAALAATLPELTVDELIASGDHWHQPPYTPTEIVPGLYQGGTDDHDVLSGGGDDFRLRGTYPFDTVITLYASAQPVPWGVEELRFGFLDSTLGIGDAGTVIRAAQFTLNRWLAGAEVLIRCQAGMNRSGLVTALVLIMAGLTPAQAITQIRLQRGPGCLFNKHFVQWLVTQASAMADPSIAATPGTCQCPGVLCR